MREKLSHVYRGGVLQETYVDHDKNMIDIVTTYIRNAPSEMTEEEFEEKKKLKGLPPSVKPEESTKGDLNE